MFNKVTFFDANGKAFTYGAQVKYKGKLWTVQDNTSCRIKLRNGREEGLCNPESVTLDTSLRTCSGLGPCVNHL